MCASRREIAQMANATQYDPFASNDELLQETAV